MIYPQEEEILKYASSWLYKDKALTQKNVECYIAGFNCAMDVCPQPIADLLQERGEYWTTEIRGVLMNGCTNEESYETLEEVKRYEEIGQLCLELADKLRKLKHVESE